MKAAASQTDCDVLIVGAGPVGLLLGGLLGAQGLRVQIVEKRTEPIKHSQAIGITPPSLKILRKLRLDERFIEAGVKVRECQVHGESGPLGRVSFRDIPDEHRFVLSLPQSATIALLREKLADFPNVIVHEGESVANVEQNGHNCRVHVGTRTITARHVIACDGARSALREQLGIRTKGGTYDVHFVMGDFIDETNLGDEARLYFTADGSIESFPLPGGQRRWIVQTDAFLDPAPVGLVSELVARRSGFRLPPEKQLNQSSFTPRWLKCERLHQGRVILCGDAAHVMSPIGGQGMNTGFADAEFLAEALTASLIHQRPLAPMLDAYDRYRGKAARTAIFRARWGMWLGTWRGRARSIARDFIMRHGLFHPALTRRVGSFYAMLTIPYATVDRVPRAALLPRSA